MRGAVQEPGAGLTRFDAKAGLGPAGGLRLCRCAGTRCRGRTAAAQSSLELQGHFRKMTVARVTLLGGSRRRRERPPRFGPRLGRARSLRIPRGAGPWGLSSKAGETLA